MTGVERRGGVSDCDELTKSHFFLRATDAAGAASADVAATAVLRLLSEDK